MTRTEVAALSAVGTLAWLTVTLLPYEVTSLATEYGAGTTGAAWVVAAELLFVAISAAWFARDVDRRDKRRLTAMGVLVALLASVASVYCEDLAALVGSRLVFGIGCGMIAAATNALPSQHPSPERVFAFMQFAVGLFFGAANLAAGFAIGPFGREYVFVIHLGFLAVLGGAALLLPPGIQERPAATTSKASGTLSSAVVACIVSAGLTWAALSAVWAFAEQAGLAVGLGAVVIANWLAVSGFATPAGGIAAAWLGERGGYRLPLVGGFAVLIGVSVAMYVRSTPQAYITGVLLLNFPITFVMAYLMGLLACLDPTGRGASIGGAAINFGSAAGPAIGALALGTDDLAPVGYLSALGLLVALLLALAAARRWRPAHA